MLWPSGGARDVQVVQPSGVRSRSCGVINGLLRILLSRCRFSLPEVVQIGHAPPPVWALPPLPLPAHHASGALKPQRSAYAHALHEHPHPGTQCSGHAPFSRFRRMPKECCYAGYYIAGQGLGESAQEWRDIVATAKLDLPPARPLFVCGAPTPAAVLEQLRLGFDVIESRCGRASGADWARGRAGRGTVYVPRAGTGTCMQSHPDCDVEPDRLESRFESR